MLRLMETHPAAAVERAVAVALERHSPRLETVRLILRQQQAGSPAVLPSSSVGEEGSVATFGITRESPLGGPRYTANPNTLWIRRV